MRSMLGNNFMSLKVIFLRTSETGIGRVDGAHLIWEVGNANTVGRGGGHCGQVNGSMEKKTRKGNGQVKVKQKEA